MKSGLLWYDASPNRTLDKKIEDAARRYAEKFGQAPNMCFVNPKDVQKLEADKLKVNVKVSSKPTILPNHIWLGVDRG